jgi:hypothetical protein
MLVHRPPCAAAVVARKPGTTIRPLAQAAKSRGDVTEQNPEQRAALPSFSREELLKLPKVRSVARLQHRAHPSGTARRACDRASRRAVRTRKAPG